MTAAIELPVLPPPADQLWHTLLDLGDQLDAPWALIGGQMVLLHAIEHGQVPPQVSQDGDVIADIRAVPGALTHAVAGLEHMGCRAAVNQRRTRAPLHPDLRNCPDRCARIAPQPFSLSLLMVSDGGTVF